MLMLGLFAVRYFAKVSKVQDSLLIPIIFTLSVVASYAISFNFGTNWRNGNKKKADHESG